MTPLPWPEKPYYRYSTQREGIIKQRCFQDLLPALKKYPYQYLLSEDGQYQYPFRDLRVVRYQKLVWIDLTQWVRPLILVNGQVRVSNIDLIPQVLTAPQLTINMPFDDSDTTDAPDELYTQSLAKLEWLDNWMAPVGYYCIQHAKDIKVRKQSVHWN